MCLAIPGKIVQITKNDPVIREGRVDFGGVLKTINLTLVPEAKIGDYVIVHVGVAISVLDEKEAQQILEDFENIGALEPTSGGRL